MIHKGFLHPNASGSVTNLPVLARGLPVPSVRGAIRPRPVPILLVQHTEEIPFQVPTLQLGLTWEVPRLGLVDVDFGDCVESEELATDLALEVVPHKFLIGGVKSETRSQGCR